MAEMSPERRERLRGGGRRRWASMSDEQRQRIRDRGRTMYEASAAQRSATLAARYPYRPAQYADFCRARDAGEVPSSMPCPSCGGPGRVELVLDDTRDDPTGWSVAGWRCYPCRRNARGAA